MRFLKRFSRQFDKIREINSRYGTPRMEMSPLVKGSLLFLRIYLFVLVGLMVYKFTTLI